MNRLPATSAVRWLGGGVLAVLLAGCANSPKAMGIPWWPQGPGNTAADLERTANSRELHAAQRTDRAQAISARPERSFDQAVRHGDLWFVSGQIADDPVSGAIVGTAIQDQVRAAMDNVARVLEAHGMAVGNIVSVTMYLESIGDLPQADAAYAAYFPRSLPARSVVGVDALPNGSRVQIAVVARK